MHLELTDEQQALQNELREYFAKLVTPEQRVEQDEEEEMGAVLAGHGAADGQATAGSASAGRRSSAARDAGRSTSSSSTRRPDAPVRPSRSSRSTPSARRSPSTARDEQKAFFLPKILAGEIHFAIGYSEPEAGTDLASLRDEGRAHGDEYIVNGQKVFTTGGHVADYIWLACRTDPDAPKHRGISILIVDTNDPGFSSTPIRTVAGGFTNATYYDDVRVPVDMLVGEENVGWRMITTQLNFERVALGPAGRIFRALDAVTEWAKETTGARRPPDDRPGVGALNLARVRAKAEACSLLNWRIASLQEHGDAQPGRRARLSRSTAPSCASRRSRLLMEVLGPEATIQKGSPGALLDGLLEVQYRGAIVGTFGGGVNEVQREIVGAAGLGHAAGAAVTEPDLADARHYTRLDEHAPASFEGPLPSRGARAFRALRHREFRLVWSTFIVGQFGFWIAFIALQALMSRLTDANGSWLGLLFFVQLLADARLHADRRRRRRPRRAQARSSWRATR